MKFTQFYIAHRGPTVAQKDFPARWLQHNQLFATFNLPPAPFGGGYLLIERAPDGTPAVKTGFEGISLMTTDDLESVKQYGDQHRSVMNKMKEDEAIAFGGDVDLTTSCGPRHIILQGKRPGFAVVLLRQRRPEVSDADFHASWMAHIDRILALPEIAGRPRYVAHTQITHLAPLPEHHYSGMTELWFDSMADCHACIAAMNKAGLPAEEAKWVIPQRSATFPALLHRKPK